MPVSRDEVFWCYRLLLGREPESENVIQDHMRSVDRNSLLKSFLSSAEFSGPAAPSEFQFTEGTISSLPMDLNALDIDVDVTPLQLVAILGRIKAAWEHLGITRAHHSVLTGPEYLPDNLAGSIEDFWASGVNEVEIIKKMLARHGQDELQNKVSVEYGCGVGRITVPLAMECRHVHAYDISSAHLSHAKARAESLARSNVTFHICSENPMGPLRECDFFYSHIVFQHNPPPIIKILVQRALQSLRPHGIAIFQVPTYMRNYQFKISQYLQGDLVKDMEMHCLPQQVIFDIISSENCALLEIREDGSTGFPMSNTFVVKKLRAKPTGAKALGGPGMLNRFRLGRDKSPH